MGKKKDAFYFSHDYNAKNDQKILLLRSKYGAAGYGVYWMIIETMAESSLPHIEHRMIPALAIAFNLDFEWLEELIAFSIKECGLFVSDGEKFTSIRILKHFELRKKLKKSGAKGNAMRWGNAIRSRSGGDANPNPKERRGKERKGKEIKGNEIKEKEEEVVRPENRTHPPKGRLSDSEFIKTLKTNAAYKDIDIDRELAKMDVWLLTPKGRHRQKTHQFIINWLNKCDSIVSAPTSESQQMLRRILK